MQESTNRVNPFLIKDCALIAVATGTRAQNLRELREQISTINLDSIYYHFWGRLLRPRFDESEYNNDFASWIARSLHDKILAERLAVLDPTAFESLESLRQEIVELIEERLDEVEYPMWSARDRQFEFIRSQIVVFDTNNVVVSPEQFVDVVPSMSLGSIYFHFVDARRRNPNSLDDFQNWLLNFNGLYLELQKKIGEIDIYFSSIQDLRNELSELLKIWNQGGEDE